MRAREQGVHRSGFCTRGLQARHACRRGVACAAAERKKAANDRALERYLRNRVRQLGTFLPPPPGSASGAQPSVLPPPDTAALLAFLRRQLADGISNEPEPPPPRPELPEAPGERGGGAAAGGADAARGRGGKKAAAGGAARKGVVILPPVPYADERRTLSLPVGITPPTAGPGAPISRLVHVFWDVESAHPGDERDPRLAAAELLRLARRLAGASPAAAAAAAAAAGGSESGGSGAAAGSGSEEGSSRGGTGVRGRVVGAYAYANRPGWTWLPTLFLNAYAGTGATADANSSGEAAVAGGGSGAAASDGEADIGRGSSGRGAAGGRPRCPVCGRQVAAAKLAAHIKQLHPDRPAAEALAAAAVARHAATAAGDEAAADDAAAAEAAALASGGAAASSSSSSTRGRAASGPGSSSRSGAANRSRSRGNPSLGAVAAYYSSGGQLYRPPAGHQLVLKYVLAREGFEPRVVQNADGAADRALNGGIDRLLAAMRSARSGAGGSLRALRLGGGGGEAAAGAAEVVLVLVSGSRRHGPALESCRRLGVRTVLVAPRRLLEALEVEQSAEREREAAGREVAAAGMGKSRRAGAAVNEGAGGGVGGADVVVEWEALASGRYTL
ncbi:hypothetical protein HXX76_004646 [Chlamydomonas incerta]|uniref:Uncharacterized protein n=1 Tax=Chlamydomonas incerta TaxID=51695 RepID=A0A835W864_CHLIN|nr:hypothetical protein HXX76_004646 [Chlamydomonas incerta]|eukprot:KAG2439286.1 hypothetical protein HXX76_004646 [Chlamydomonas incerta]